MYSIEIKKKYKYNAASGACPGMLKVAFFSKLYRGEAISDFYFKIQTMLRGINEQAITRNIHCDYFDLDSCIHNFLANNKYKSYAGIMCTPHNDEKKSLIKTLLILEKKYRLYMLIIIYRLNQQIMLVLTITSV